CFPAYCLPARRTRAAFISFTPRYDFVTPLPHRAGRIGKLICLRFAPASGAASAPLRVPCFRGDVPWRTILQKTAKAWHPRPAHYLETDHVASRVRNVKQAKRKRIFMPRARVVVVEDDSAIRRGVVDVLRATGYEVAEASDGA